MAWWLCALALQVRECETHYRSLSRQQLLESNLPSLEWSQKIWVQHQIGRTYSTFILNLAMPGDDDRCTCLLSSESRGSTDESVIALHAGSESTKCYCHANALWQSCKAPHTSVVGCHHKIGHRGCVVGIDALQTQAWASELVSSPSQVK